MPVSAYSITVPRTDVTVDASARTAQFSVDVKNEQSAPDRVVLGIEAVTTGAGAADPSWFSVDRHQRAIPAGGSEQYLVSVAVGAEVAAGAFLLRPVAYSSDRPPDDTKVDGPVMTLTLPAPLPPPLPWWRRWWPWWLIGVGVLLLLAAAVTVLVVVLSHSSPPPPPPDSTSTPSPTNPPNRALQFDGGKVVTIPSGPHVSAGLTVQATITPATPAGLNAFGGIVRATQGGGHSWVLFTQGNRWGLSVCTPSCNAVSAPLAIGEKHVITGTYDGHTIAIYQDGVQLGSVPWSNSVSPSTGLQIGRWTTGFTGVIDDVAVWNTPLAGAQVSAAAAHPPTGPQTGLVGLWRFNEQDGQQVLDSSGNGLDGFLGDSSGPDPADPDRVQVKG